MRELSYIHKSVFLGQMRVKTGREGGLDIVSAEGWWLVGCDQIWD